MSNNLKIEYIDIDEIKTYSNNAKLHPAEQIEQIKKSIQEFGFNDPIAIDKDNIIIEGHGRYIACKELGIKELPVIRLENLTDEQKRAYMLVHNKLTMNSDFDIDLLNEELQGLIDFYDMEDFGFPIQIEDIDEYHEGIEKIGKELDEANNYVVLEFFTGEEWERAIEVLGLEKVTTPHKYEKVRKHGIGRVIDGKTILDRLEGIQ